MNEIFGPFVRVPLGVTEEPGSIVDEPHQQRLDPLTFTGEHLAGAVMEVQVQQLQDILDLVAADLALLPPATELPRTFDITLRGLPARR